VIDDVINNEAEAMTSSTTKFDYSRTMYNCTKAGCVREREIRWWVEHVPDFMNAFLHGLQ